MAEAYRDSNPTLAGRHLKELIACEDCPNRAQAIELLSDLAAVPGLDLEPSKIEVDFS